MLSRERRTRYKGSDITVRWGVEDSTAAGRLFSASLSVAATDTDPDAWQRFPDRLFHTFEYACRFALDEARRAIDEALKAKGEL
jgi:hypothetical protein